MKQSLYCIEAWTEVRKWDVERTYVWAETDEDARSIIETAYEPHQTDAQNVWSDGTDYEVIKLSPKELPEGINPYEISLIKEEM